jgi:hypothetical protein
MTASKYRNRKVELDGHTFDSAKEAKRWGELKLLERAGQIANLQRQVRYPLIINGRRVCSLIADFAYEQEGRVVVEDTKSDFTRKLPVWRIKSKLFEALNGFPIREV